MTESVASEQLPAEAVHAPGVDSELLGALRRHQSEADSYVEEFLDEPLGPRASWAILTSPLGRNVRGGCVLCSSLGQEAGTHRRLESTIAQSLAARGFASLRLRPSGRSPEPAMDVEARMAEVVEAVEALRERSLETSTLVGIGFGATMAALVCQDLELDAMALVEPVVVGRSFLNESLTRHAVVELMTAGEVEGKEPGEKPRTELTARGSTTVRGFRLTQADADRMSAIDLVHDLHSFDGRGLIVTVSASGKAPPRTAALAARFEEIGARASLEILRDELPVPFGEYYFTGTPPSKVDSRFALDRRIAGVVSGWVAREDETQGGAAE